MLEIYEAALKGHRCSPLKAVTTLTLEGALSPTIAKELGGSELYRKNSTLADFVSHGFNHDIESANVTFYPLPGTAGEKNALLHLPNCAVRGFSAAKLDGQGAKLSFSVTDDANAKAIIEFLVEVRGWNGKLTIEELQMALPGTENGDGAEEEEAVQGLPPAPKKRGRGGNKRPAEVTPIKSGRKRLNARHP